MATKRKKNFDRVVAIDLGNGMVKIRSLDLKTGKPYELVLPCAWGYKKDVGDKLINEDLELDTFYIGEDETAYVWGEDIKRLGSKVKIAFGHENRYKSEPYKIMAIIAMAKAVDDLEISPTEKIYLVTGVPSAETKTERETELVSAFLGDNNGIHEVDVNGTERFFRIAHVEVMSQPVSTVIGRYLDEDGYVGDEEYEKLKVGIIDIGGGTTDLDIVDKLQRQNTYTSIPKGFSDVYKSIRRVIKQKYPSHDVTDFQLLTNLEEKNYKPNIRYEGIDFSKEMESGIREVSVDIQQAILSQWKDQTDLDEILLIGGGAREFEQKLSSVVTGLTIPDNHQYSNVEGYYRWGVNRVGVEE